MARRRPPVDDVDTASAVATHLYAGYRLTAPGTGPGAVPLSPLAVAHPEAAAAALHAALVATEVHADAQLAVGGDGCAIARRLGHCGG